MKNVYLLVVLLFFSVSTVHAATVTFASGNITADTDVLTTGSLVWAYEFGDNTKAGSTANPTVNGVTFTSTSKSTATSITTEEIAWATNSTATFGNASPTYMSTGNNPETLLTSLSTNYTSLLSDGFSSGNNPAAATVTFTISGLVSGEIYVLQMWFNDSRSSSSAFTTTITEVGTANAVTIKRQESSSKLGNWVTATFVADTSEEISFTMGGSNYVGMNAIQLRAIPEPSTYALAGGIFALGVALAARRRAKK